MPRLSRWMIRAAFAYLLLGFTFGALLLAHKVMPLHSGLWAWRPAHIEFLGMVQSEQNILYKFFCRPVMLRSSEASRSSG